MTPNIFQRYRNTHFIFLQHGVILCSLLTVTNVHTEWNARTSYVRCVKKQKKDLHRSYLEPAPVTLSSLVGSGVLAGTVDVCRLPPQLMGWYLIRAPILMRWMTSQKKSRTPWRGWVPIGPLMTGGPSKAVHCPVRCELFEADCL